MGTRKDALFLFEQIELHWLNFRFVNVECFPYYIERLFFFSFCADDFFLVREIFAHRIHIGQYLLASIRLLS